MSQEECGNEAKKRNMKYYGLQDQGGIGGRRGQCFWEIYMVDMDTPIIVKL